MNIMKNYAEQSERENGKVYFISLAKNEQQMDFMLLFKCSSYSLFILCYSYENCESLWDGRKNGENLIFFK